MKACSRCVFVDAMPLWLVPDNMPARLRTITVGADGVCNVCRAFLAENDPEALEDEVGQMEFDVIASRAPAVLALSGGKDSLATLWWARKELDLPVVALLYDNGFIPDETIARAKEACRRTDTELVVARPSDDEIGGFARDVAQIAKESASPCLRCAKHMTHHLGTLCDARNALWILSGTNYFAHWGARPSALHHTRTPNGRTISVMHLPFGLRRTRADTVAALDELGLQPLHMEGLSSNCRVPALVQARVADALGHVPEQEDLALEVLVGHRTRESAVADLHTHAPRHAPLLNVLR